MRRLEEIFELICLFLAVILLNLLAERSFFRLDLTQDKRYTMSEAGEKVIEKLDDEIFITVYLDGELNAQFKRLQKGISETLDEFKAIGGKKIRYQFVNPENINDPQERKAFYDQLAQKGLPPTTLFEVVNGKKYKKLFSLGQ